MLDLPTLWKNRLKLIAANLKYGEREHREVATTAQHVRWDYHGRFLIELIQNAADQATRAGLTKSEIVIVRTAGVVAVLNQGRPLDDEGFRALSSLSYDTKDPTQAIGNKGLGFKSVFQISDKPEVYSAPIAGGGLLAEGGYRFAFSSRPFEHPSLVLELENVASEFEQDDPEGARSACDRHGVESFADLLLLEATHSAPFRFPLPLDIEPLNVRAGELGLDGSQLQAGSALVVLPIAPQPEAQTWVDAALDDVVSDARGTTLLFLEGVATLRYEDRRDGTTHTLERAPRTTAAVRQRGPGYGRISRCTTTRTSNNAGGVATSETSEWWVCSRTLGDATDSDEGTAKKERERIQDAVAGFPGDHWARVDRATVDIATLIPKDGRDATREPGTDGLFCIGLPTKMGTGMRVWINARFHGSIARTSIDIEQNAYNKLLFDEAVRLLGDLVEALKTAQDLPSRRLATLMLESTPDSILAAALRRPDGLFSQEVVLDADGLSYMRAPCVLLPKTLDESMFWLLSNHGTEPGGQFALPEEWLMRNARPLLLQLGASEGPIEGPDRRFLERDDSELSLIERGARAHRAKGPEFWEPFVKWLLDRYTATLIADQRVLPTGRNGISAAAEKVYAAPVIPSSALEGIATDDPQRLDRVIETRLLLFDEACLALRAADRATYTAIGNRLRQADPPLIREPELADLVREVFGPRIQDLTTTQGNEREALALLRIIAEWAQAREVRDLPLHTIRVPCHRDDGPEWEWLPPGRVYLGRGWQDAEIDGLLVRAYAETPGRLLVSWTHFASLAGADEADRDWWVRGFGTLGVWGNPRVLLHTHPIAPLQATSYVGPLQRTQGSRCPPALASVQDRWNEYIENIRWRKANVASGQSYDLEKLRWIDGLESEERRVDVVALLLARNNFYEGFLTTKLSRVQGHGDASEVPSFWVHALRESGWSTIPTSHGILPPKQAWLLVGDQRRQRAERYRFLPCVTESAESAHRLLRAVGVATLEDADPGRYVGALQSIASRIEEFRGDDMSDAIVVTEELYRQLQARLTAGAVALPELLERPLPMLDGIEARRLRAVDLNQPGMILVDDNPVRGKFVVDARAAAVLPISFRRGYRALVTAIEEQLGEGSVSYTSNAPVAVGFTPGPLPDTTIGAFLERAFPERPVRRDVAILLSAVATGISAERIASVLARFDTVHLRFGAFATDAEVTSFLHEQPGETPALFADESLQPCPDRVFSATWELVGAHRDLWAAYAAALHEGVTERFLRERGVSPADIRRAQDLVDPARAVRFDAIKPLILALALAGHHVADVEQFNKEWPNRSRGVDVLAQWIGRPELADVIALAAGEHDVEQATLNALQAADVTVERWQGAREMLGLTSYRFARSRTAFERGKEIVVSALMATAAHAVSVDLSAARRVLDQIRAVEPVPELLRLPSAATELLPYLIGWVRTLLEQDENGSLGVLSARIEEALAANAEDAEATLMMRVAQREVDEYRLPEADRSVTAQRDVNIVLNAAVQLASHIGESLDWSTVQRQPRVEALSAGWWANRFAVLDALHQALEQSAPRTARRLSEVRAFRDPGPPGTLIGRLAELTVISPQPQTPAPTPRQLTIASVQLTRADLDPDLARGSDGQIGSELRRHAGEHLDFEALRAAERPAARSRMRRGGWSGGSRGGSSLERQDERDINGLLGEAFVYEQFRDLLPGFDYQCWRSENGVRYGVSREGDDNLGADFLYRDVSGALTGRDDAPEVYIEVKATSDEGSTPFEMTDNEWDTALRIHLDDVARVYVVVRVAHIRAAPMIYRVFVDPVRLSEEGLLIVEASDRLIRGS